MSCRTLRRAIACIHERTRRRWPQIKSRDVYKSRVCSQYSSGPRGWNERRTCRHPIVAAGADATIHPTHARLEHNLINRCTADAEEHVVVHLQTLDALKDLDAWTHLTLSQDER